MFGRCTGLGAIAIKWRRSELVVLALEAGVGRGSFAFLIHSISVRFPLLLCSSDQT